MTIVEFPCTRCGKVLRLAQTSSLFDNSGRPYPIYCGPCSTPVDPKLEARIESVKELVILTHLQAITGLFITWSDRIRPMAQYVVGNADWRTSSGGLVSLKAHELASQELKRHWPVFDALHEDFANSTADPELCAQKLLQARKLSFSRVYVGMTLELVDRMYKDAEELDQELNQGRHGFSILETHRRDIKQTLNTLGDMLASLTESVEQQIATLMEDNE